MIYPNSKRFLPIYKNGGSEPPTPPGPDYSIMPLTFKSHGNTTIQRTQSGGDIGTLSASVDGGQTWIDFAYQTSLQDGQTLILSGNIRNSARKIKIKCQGEGTMQVYGNAASLYNFTDNLPEYEYWGTFEALFSGSTRLVDASNLIIPSASWKNQFCRQMFKGCTSLTAAPNLPVNTLAPYCYYEMFRDCTSLKTAPDIQALTLDSYSTYTGMFQNCTALTGVKIHTVNNPNDNQCFNYFCNGCTSLQQIEVDFTDWNIFRNCFDIWTNVPGTGTFIKPTLLPVEFDNNYRIPVGWTVVTK